MTDTSYYPPVSSPRQRGGTGTPGPVMVAVGPPAAQRRATVAIRFILAIPHFFALYFLGIAALAVVVLGWFAALVTGRLPGFAAAYLSGYLRWYGRAFAYLLLLTDAYPPFAFGDAAYPVQVAVGSGKLSRLSVLFRGVLAIPAWTVLGLLTNGFATIVSFIGWLIALVAGRLPASLHQAFAAVLRYTVRCYGYQCLLTGSYPAGLFGDQPGAPGDGAAVAGQPARYPDYGSPSAGYGPSGYGPSGTGYDPGAYGAPAYDSPGYGTAGYGAPAYDSPGYGTPGYGAPAYGAPGQDAGWALVLSAGAKRLVRLMLVLGLLTAAGAGARVGASVAAARQRDREINQLDADLVRLNAAVARHNAAVAREQQAVSQVDNATQTLTTANDTLNSVLTSPSTDSSNCTTVYCFQVTSLPDANAFVAFGRVLRATAVPPASAPLAKRLLTDNTQDAQDWKEMAQADSFTSIENYADAAEKVGGRWDDDYPALITSLNNEDTTLGNEALTLDNGATSLNRQAAALDQRAAELNVPIHPLSAAGAS
jgi:Domain of unknown function (DUF4389)